MKNYPYVYTDEDGTEHYFQKSNVTYLENGASKTVSGSAAVPSAKDEDGLKLFIVPVSNKTLKEKYPLKLIDKSSSIVRYFDKMGRLAMIMDSNQYENAKNSSTKEKNCVIIDYESCGDNILLTAYEEAIAAAQNFRDLCYKSGVAVNSAEYVEARDTVWNTVIVIRIIVSWR